MLLGPGPDVLKAQSGFLERICPITFEAFFSGIPSKNQLSTVKLILMGKI